MARSEGKAWLSPHVLSLLMQPRVRSSSGFFGKLVVSGSPARLPKPGGGRISKIGYAAPGTRREFSLGFRKGAPYTGNHP